MNKQTLKDNKISCCLLRLYLADPATLLASNSAAGTFIFLYEQLVYSVMEKINKSEFGLSPH